MSNFNIRINADANLKGTIAQFSALKAEIDALNMAMEKSVVLSDRVNPAGYAKMAQAVKVNSQITRNAAMSTGMFEVQQLRLNSATEEYTKAIEKQKLTFKQWYNELRAGGKVRQAAIKEQLALQNMVVKQMPGAVGGKKVLDVYIPTEVSKDLKNFNTELGFMREELRAASTQLVNWGKNTQWAGRQLMVGFTIPVAAFGAAAAVMTYKVDKQLTRIKKVYDTTAQSVAGDSESMAAQQAELSRVAVAAMATATNAARQYGQAITDTLDVQAELAATGLKGFNLQQATMQTMRIATLGELDTKQAVTMTNALQSAFKGQIKTTEDLTNAFNFMNAVENQTSLTTQDIAEAIPRAASSMATLGVTVQQMIVLLASMKQNGVDAAEGANALKSATTRIINPVKKATEYYDKYNISLEQIRDESGGNLFEFLKRLGVEQQKIQGPTQKATNLMRAQGVAMLFGTYQNARLTASLTNLADGFVNTSSQTGRAIKLMGSDMESLANIADQELSAIQNSASGKFKIAIESVKAELATMGEPFLEVGTQVLSMLDKIMHAFNNLPKGVKKGAALTAIAAAILGPLVMLTGLAANFGGNIVKMGVSVLGLATNFKLLNKESRAAQLAAQLADAGFLSERKQVELLTAQIENLTKAAQEGALAQKQLMLAGNSAVVTAVSKNSKATDLIGTKQPVVPDMPFQGRLRSTQALLQGGLAPVNSGTPFAHDSKWEAEHPRPGQRHVTPTNGLAMRTPVISDEDVKNSERVEKSTHGAAIAAGAFGVAMAASLVSSNRLVDDIAQWTMVATMVAPAFTGITAAMKSINLSAITTSAAAGLSKMSLAANAVNGALYNAYTKGAVGIKNAMTLAKEEMILTTAGAGRLGGRFTTLKADAAIIASNLGPGRGGMTYAMQAAKYHANVLSNTIVNGVNSGIVKTNVGIGRLGTGMRSVGKGAGKLAGSIFGMVSPIGWIGAGLGVAAGAAYLMYKHIESGKKSAIEMYDSVEGLGKILNFTPTDMQTTLDKSGKSIVTMGTKVQAFRKEYEGVTKAIREADNDQTKFNFAMAQGLKVISSGGTAEQAKEAVEIALRAGAKTAKEADAIVMKFKAQIDFTDAQKNVDAFVANSIQAMKDTKKEDVGFWDSLFGGNDKEMKREEEFASKAGKNISQAFVTATMNGLKTDKVVSSIQATLDALDKKIASAGPAGQAGRPLERQLALRKAFVQAIADAGNGEQKVVDKINASTDAMQLLKDLGYDVDSAVDSSSTSASDLEGNLGDAGDEAGTLADNVEAAKSAMEQFNEAAKGAAQGAMKDTQSALASIASDNFTTKMNNAMDAYKKSQDARMDALKSQEDAETAAMDARWERRKKGTEAYYDARIKKVKDAIDAEQKAEDIRQKIFDAEITRMQRLAQMQNTNIDFNVALNSGNLDEAAKIRNDDMAQQMEWALSDSADTSKSASDKKVERLGKKQDRIDAAKDKALAALDIQEKAEKASLERRQKLREKALQEEIDQNVKAQQEIWDDRKEKLDRAIELFKMFVPRNEEELKRHVAAISKQYADFNVSTKGEFNVTAVDIGKMLKQNLRDAARSIRSDISWAQIGADSATDMIQGAFGLTPEQFQTWLEGGKLPKGFKIGQGAISQLSPVSNEARENKMTFHTGGIVGQDNGGQAGIRKGHPDEVNITALKGEGVLNRSAMKNIGPVSFRQLNRGQLGTAENPIGGPGPNYSAGLGLGGLLGSLMAATLKSTIAGALVSGIKARKHGLGGKVGNNASPTDNGPGMVGNDIGGGYISGSGGWHKASIPGRGWSNTHDYRNPIGSPLYAASDGMVVESRAITSGGSPGNGKYSTPYRSYGETILLRTASGDLLRYAHLSPGQRFVKSGQRVKGGALIGKSGETGNAWGPHTHFDVNGDYNASGWMNKHGISLRKGAQNIKWDNTIANLHKGEGVLTEDINNQFKQGVKRFAEGPDAEYNLYMTVNGSNVKVDELVNKTMTAMRRLEMRKPKSRSGK